MRQLIFEGPGQLSWQDAPEPTMETPKDALVRPLAVAGCDADVAALTDQFPTAPPFPFGHEFVAQVVDVGAEVTASKAGDVVSIPVQISCGECERCRRGLTATCKGVTQPAGWGFGPFGGNWPGAFADMLRVPFADHMMVQVPDGLEPERIASAGDNIPDAYRSVGPHLANEPDARVLVIGYRSIGLYAAAIAVALGAPDVVYADTDESRLATAERVGAKPLQATLGERVGSFPIVVNATETAEGLSTAVNSLSPGGVCTCTFPGFREMTLPSFELWQRGVRLDIGAANCRMHIPDVLELISSGRLRPELVTSEVVEWDDADRALREPSIKPVFVRD